jgi:hypothetical protein
MTLLFTKIYQHFHSLHPCFFFLLRQLSPSIVISYLYNIIYNLSYFICFFYEYVCIHLLCTTKRRRYRILFYFYYAIFIHINNVYFFLSRCARDTLHRFSCFDFILPIFFFYFCQASRWEFHFCFYQIEKVASLNSNLKNLKNFFCLE